MEKMKLVSTVLLSLMLIFTISTVVFADNETEGNDIWSDGDIWGNATIEENTAEVNTTVENETVFENIQVENEIENEVENEIENEVLFEEEENEYDNLYVSRNSTTSNSENLADTGIEDSNVMVLIILVSAIVAIYSAKKFNEYKNV